MGRPKGSLNRITKQAREFARKILDSEEYRNSIERRIGKDSLPGGVEVMLWYYAYGKPTEKVDVSFSETADLSDLTEAQLAERAQHLAKHILEAQDNDLGEQDSVH